MVKRGQLQSNKRAEAFSARHDLSRAHESGDPEKTVAGSHQKTGGPTSAPIDGSLGAQSGARRALRAAQKALLLEPKLSRGEKKLLRSVSLSLHAADRMFIHTADRAVIQANARHYLSVGLSAVRCIGAAVEAANRNAAVEVRTILDLPCGFGRVLRFLPLRFPAARVVGCDIDERAIAFCAREFSVFGVHSSAAFADVRLPGPFDLIWCGSLVTHLKAHDAADLLRLFFCNLSVGGLCVFTTHGTASVEAIESGRRGYGLTPEAQSRVLSGYRSDGYGYADFTGRPGWGISVASPDGIKALAHPSDAWDQLSYLEQGWDNHQDVQIWTRQT